MSAARLRRGTPVHSHFSRDISTRRQPDDFAQRRLRFELYEAFQFFHARFATAHVVKAHPQQRRRRHQRQFLLPDTRMTVNRSRSFQLVVNGSGCGRSCCRNPAQVDILMEFRPIHFSSVI